MKSHKAEKRKSSDSIISDGGRPIKDNSNTDDLKYLCISINFIDPWLKS